MGGALGAVRRGRARRCELLRDGDAEPDRYPAFTYTSADQVAAEGLSAAARGLAVSVPGMLYKAIVGAANVTPRAVLRRIAGLVNR